MHPRELTARILILALLNVSLISGNTPVNLKERVDRFGVGTELKLKLKNGEKLRGSVESIGQDNFVVSLKERGATREIAFNDLQNVSYPKRGYKAEGTPDPDAARRMVVQLGVGEHIMVQVSPTQKIRGHIREIGDDHFIIHPDGQASALQVPYSSIHKVNKNLSFGATLAIVVLIAATVVLILVLTGEDDVDVLPN
jgi:ribosome maturation factor RimP